MRIRGYRKLPVVVMAVQWRTLDEAREVARWCGGWVYTSVDEAPRLVIRTLEDTDESAHWSEPGDWIVQGVAGEYYPVKPAIFAATYEEVV